MNLKLTPFFKEVIEMRWSEFCQMEAEEEHTSAQAVVLAIVRACAKGKLPAIKESLNRIDGKLQEQIEVEYPKFFIQYPHATALTAGAKTPEGKEISFPVVTGSEEPTPDPMRPLVTGSLRDTLERMSDEPKYLVQKILDAAEDVETRKAYAADHEPLNNPLVKSVIVAGLLKMAHNGSLSAIFEVFDNLDGKLVDKIKILGDDVYLTSYDTLAPAGAKLVEGVYQIEADNTTSAWAVSLKRKQEGR
jgi:hypothetical protein